MITTKELRALKIHASDQRKMHKRDERKQKRLQRRCFFTRPWGHEYVWLLNEADLKERRCIACGKHF